MFARCISKKRERDILYTVYSLIADQKAEVRLLDIPGGRCYHHIEKRTVIGVEFDDGSE